MDFPQPPVDTGFGVHDKPQGLYGTKALDILAQWRTNMMRPQPPDPEFEKFLSEEGREIDEILENLGT